VERWNPAQLAAELRRGGYTLYFRHTATDFSQNDTRSRGFEDCANQRNLTAAGRADARAVGAAIKALGIPVSRAGASPLCRTLETARLMLGQAEPVPELRGSGPGNPGRYWLLLEWLSTPQPAGHNLFIVSHGNPFYGTAGPPYLAEGEAAVVRGRGDGAFDVVARIRVEDWAALRQLRN